MNAKGKEKMMLRDDDGSIYVVAYNIYKSNPDGSKFKKIKKLPKGFRLEFIYINPNKL